MKLGKIELGVGGTILFYLSFLFATGLLLFGVTVSSITLKIISQEEEIHFRDKGIMLSHMVGGKTESLRSIKDMTGAIDVLLITGDKVYGMPNPREDVEKELIMRCEKSRGTEVKKEGRYFEVFHKYPENGMCVLAIFRKSGEIPSFLPQMAIVTLAFLIAFIPFGYWFIRNNVVLPIRNFYRAVEELAHGNQRARAPLDGPKEIKYLADRFNKTVEELILRREELENIVKEIERVNENLKRIQQEIIQAEKFAVTGKLASGIAHEIGNPINTIYMLIELLREAENEGKRNEYIERIKEEVERIEKFTRNLLDLSRPIKPEIKKVNPQEILRRALEIVFMKKVPNVETKIIPSSVSEIETDPSMLMQVLINIILNARDAVMEKGGGEIRSAVYERGNEVIIEIADTGTGIDKEILPNIFEPFFTTKSKEKGTGLGLTISQRIVCELGGRIEVESKKGEGSIFRIILPRGLHQPSS